MMQRKWIQAILMTVLSILVLQFFIEPVYVSDDDVLYMLMLSGSLGNPPTNLLHITYGWHPGYGWIIKTLFIYYPQVNWYTLFLLLFHAIGLSAVCHFLLSRFKFFIALVLFLLLFVVFEARLLQHPDFTGSSLMCAIGGCLLLSRAKEKAAYLYLGAGMILAALLLRFHISGLVVLLFTPLLFFPLSKKNTHRIVMCFFGLGLSWLLLHQAQVEYYKQNIPNWEERSSFRDAFYYYVNHNTNKEKHIEVIKNEAALDLLRKGFLYDSARFNTSTFSALGEATSGGRNLHKPVEQAALYWGFMGNRIYLALLFLTGGFLYITNSRIFFRRAIYILLPVAIWLYMVFFLKVTLTIYFAFFISILFYWLDGFSKSKSNYPFFFRWYAGVGLVVLLLWSGKLISDKNVLNNKYLAGFNCYAGLLKNNSDILFVAANFNIALKHLPAWIVPASYKLDNLLYYQRILTDDQKNILQQHAISDSFPNWLLHEKVRLLGEPLPDLTKYCYEQYGLRIKIVEDTSSGCMKRFMILPAYNQTN